MKTLVVYNHGKDSTPWGEKTLAFAEVAKYHGFDFESLDYRQTNDPEERIRQLLTFDVSGYQKQDDIVPPENAWKFSHTYRIRLLMLDSDHRLLDQLPLLTAEFERFLLQV